MSDHPKFVAHNDWRETFRLSEVDDDTCKLVILTDDQLEILRRALKAARKRGNWIDSEDADGYMTPDDGDWDDTLALLDDLEYKLMSACENVVLDDNAIIQIQNGQQPTENTPTGMALLALGDGYDANRIMAADGDYAISMDVYAAGVVAGLSAFNWDSMTGFNLVINGNGGNVGIGKTPGYALDVNGAARISGAFGCNGATPQTKYDLPGGCYDLTTAIELINEIRTALSALGMTT